MLTKTRITGVVTLAAIIAAVSVRLGGAARPQRVRCRALDESAVLEFVAKYRACSRQQLIAEGFLAAETPQKGGRAIGLRHRTESGDRLLRDAKEVLYALLFGEESDGVRLQRIERELLAVTVPRAKIAALEFMQASTELAGAGTWRDPSNVASDSRADNVIMEVEYGEVESEAVGDGILAALRLINQLEINEQVLYARMTNIEQSTLVD